MRLKRWIVVCIAALPAVGCGTSGGQLTIPQSDNTYPLVLLDVVPTGASLMTVTTHSLPITLHVKSNDSLSFVGLAVDDDGGAQNIQIWQTVRQCRNIGGGLVTCSGPGTPGAPAKDNPDTGKKPGDIANTRRVVAMTLDMHTLTIGFDSVEVKVWAVGINFSNLSEQTQEVTLEYP